MRGSFLALLGNVMTLERCTRVTRLFGRTRYTLRRCQNDRHAAFGCGERQLDTYQLAARAPGVARHASGAQVMQRLPRIHHTPRTGVSYESAARHVGPGSDEAALVRRYPDDACSFGLVAIRLPAWRGQRRISNIFRVSRRRRSLKDVARSSLNVALAKPDRAN
jgi:hypothetical protein